MRLTPKESYALPDLADLASRLRFSAPEGRIWLDDQRMLLLHLSAFAALREELVGAMGMRRARGLLMRMGYTSGSRDADLVRKVRPGRGELDAFFVGPQMHMLEGIVRVEPVRVEMDQHQGHYYGEFLWHDSSEDDAHLSVFGVGSEPACWMQIGYASGYTSAFMGRPIAYREVECRSMGDAQCRIIGRPLEQWPDPEEERTVYEFDRKGRGQVNVCGTMDLPDPEEADGADEPRLVGASSGFIAAFHRLEQVATANTSALLLGETGVGKERFARMLHDMGCRAKAPFIAVNCSAIPHDLIESELFGVERGAFTGAVESRPGRFERADGGTLFLDEVGTLSPSAQAKLLRALQEREIERVGGTCSKSVDVRVVAATNVDLRAEVEARRFRADLYYRISVFPIRIPPLRERRDDIPRLVEHFLLRFSVMHGKKVAGFTARAIDALLDYPYPGNIRELENMVERAVILVSAEEPIDVGHLLDAGDALEPRYMSLSAEGALTDGDDGEPEEEDVDMIADQALDAALSVDELETKMLEKAVARAGGNLSHAAKLLGLTRPQLAYRLKKRLSE